MNICYFILAMKWHVTLEDNEIKRRCKEDKEHIAATKRITKEYEAEAKRLANMQKAEAKRQEKEYKKEEIKRRKMKLILPDIMH